MNLRIHPHAAQRMDERGTTLEEVIATVETGEQFPARFDRTCFRRNFSFGAEWRGRTYASKQVEVYAVDENGWLVISVIVKYF